MSKLKKLMSGLVLLFLLSIVGVTLYMGLTDSEIPTESVSIQIPNERFF